MLDKDYLIMVVSDKLLELTYQYYDEFNDWTTSD